MFEDDDDDFLVDENFLQDVLQASTSASCNVNNNYPEKRRSDESLKPDEDSSTKKLKDSNETSFLSHPFHSSTQLSTRPIQNDRSDLVQTPNEIGDLLFKDLKCGAVNRNEVTKLKLTASSSKRKFPGPAGLLPQLDKKNLEEDLKEVGKHPTSTETITPGEPVCSQSSTSTFDSGPWMEASKAFGMKPGDPTCPLGCFTVAWARQRAAAKRLPQHKIPFILLALRTIDPSSKDPSVTFHDPTGKMHGILHQEFWLEHITKLVVGSVLALRQVGLMSFGPFSRHQCLSITGNNVIAIFAPGSEDEPCTQRINVSTIPREQLLRETAISPTPASITPQKPRSLFSTVINKPLSKSIPAPLTPRNKPGFSQTSNTSKLNPHDSFSPSSSVKQLSPHCPTGNKLPASSTVSNASSKLQTNFINKSSTIPPHSKSDRTIFQYATSTNTPLNSKAITSNSKHSATVAISNQTANTFAKCHNIGSITNFTSTIKAPLNSTKSAFPSRPSAPNAENVVSRTLLKNMTSHLNAPSKSQAFSVQSSSSTSIPSSSQTPTPTKNSSVFVQRVYSNSTNSTSNLLNNTNVNFSSKHYTSTNHFQAKQPSAQNKALLNPPSNIQQDDVDSLLEGLDADALFGDF